MRFHEEAFLSFGFSADLLLRDWREFVAGEQKFTFESLVIYTYDFAKRCDSYLDMKTVRSLKRAVKAGMEGASTPIPKERRYRVAGKIVKCSHCSGELFEWGPAFAPMIVGLALQCAKCSHLEIFADSEKVDAID